MMKHIQIMSLVIVLLLLAGWLLGPPVFAAGTTVTVDTTGDDGDASPGDGVCVTAGGECSLRAAIQELNALGVESDPHQIHFNIPGAGPHVITPTAALPDVVVPVVIGGSTQPGATCPTGNAPADLMIVLDGSNAGANADGLVLESGSDGSTVKGLVIGNFDAYGIRILSDGNKVRCNHIGLDADGVSPMGNSHGLLLSGAQNEIGGANTHVSRNIISANRSHGIQFSAFGKQNDIVNNFIGTTADGVGDLGNGSNGLYISGNDNLIGGGGSIARNVISGNDGSGIQVYLGGGNVILGNYFGIARNGLTPLPNDRYGIYLLGGAVANVIGSTNPGEGNLIAYNGGEGVVVMENPTGVPVQNEIRGNAIFDNFRLGIDLGNDGVDINDVLGDGDVGENEQQNYPVLLSATDGVSISGTLDSKANTEYRIDFYRSPSCDPSGYGEGQEYLATGTLTADGDGHADFEVNLPFLSVLPGNNITATATDSDGNTSEFSACITVVASTSTPTPTNTATPGPSPTPTNTATLGPSPTATWTPEPPTGPAYFIYLPAVIRGS